MRVHTAAICQSQTSCGYQAKRWRTADTVETIRSQQDLQKRAVQQQRLAKRRGDA